VARGDAECRLVAEYGSGGAEGPDAAAAAAALIAGAAPAPPADVWPELNDFLEEVHGDAESTKKVEQALSFLSDSLCYCKCQLVAILLADVPDVFRLMQGGSQNSRHAAVQTAVAKLKGTIRGYRDSPGDVVGEVVKRLRLRLADAARRLRDQGKDDEAKATEDTIAAKVAQAEGIITRLVEPACAAFLANTTHLDAAMARLRQRQLFDPEVKPPETFPQFPAGTPMWTCLGVLERDMSFGERARIAGEWSDYKAKRDAGTLGLPPHELDDHGVALPRLTPRQLL